MAITIKTIKTIKANKNQNLNRLDFMKISIFLRVSFQLNIIFPGFKDLANRVKEK